MAIGFPRYTLDEKRCWKLRCAGGSWGDVQRVLLKEGELNQTTGRVAGISGIQKAAFRWATAHREESRKDLAYYWSLSGKVLTDEDWNTFLRQALRLAYHRRPEKLRKFIVQHGLQHLGL